MKKALLIIFLLLVTFGASAEVYKYKTTEFAYRTLNSRGYWNDWSSWEESSMLIVINTNADKVDIYSQTPQHYDIIEYGGKESDGQGGKMFTLSCVDADGSRCNIRTRIQKDGQMQLYVDYSDASWVYNIHFKY